MNVQLCIIREIMLYESKLSYNTTGAIKTFIEQKNESTVDHKWFHKSRPVARTPMILQGQVGLKS